MEFTSKLTPYGFINLFKNYKKESLNNPIGILIADNFEDDYLSVVKEEPYMNFVNDVSEINKDFINVVPIKLITNEKFDAILVAIEGMTQEEKEKAFNTASEQSIQRSIFTNYDDVMYYEQLKSNTKTTELIDRLDNFECTALEIGTKMICIELEDSIKYYKKQFEAYNIDLIIEDTLDYRAWLDIKNPKKKNSLVHYNFTNIKNEKYSKLRYLIGKYLYDYLDETSNIKNGKIIYFKKPCFLVAQNSKMKDATDSYYDIEDNDNQPFDTQIYAIVGFRLKKKIYKRSSPFIHFGPREMYFEKRDEYWGKRFPFDMLDEY